jgi:hypothetical protein
MRREWTRCEREGERVQGRQLRRNFKATVPLEIAAVKFVLSDPIRLPLLCNKMHTPSDQHSPQQLIINKLRQVSDGCRFAIEGRIDPDFLFLNGILSVNRRLPNGG